MWCKPSLVECCHCTVEHTGGALVPHVVVECTVEEKVEVVSLILQECLQRTVEEMVDVPFSSNTAHSEGGLGRFTNAGHGTG